MRRLLLLAILSLTSLALTGCGGATAPTNPAQATSPASTTAPASTTGTSATSAPAPGPPTAAAGGVIPAMCAAGFTDYLKLIEPVVSGFDPATAQFGDFYGVDDAANEQGIQAMTANGGKATYSCSEVGLEFNYFDTHSPWAAILEMARAKAPGTVGYLEVSQKVAAIDVSQMADYGVASCDDAVSRIKKAVADDTGAGKETVAELGVDAGLALFGLYSAYLSDVQDGACPADVLGSAEFDFMQEQ